MKNLFVFFVLVFVVTICSGQVGLEVSLDKKYQVEVGIIEGWGKVDIAAEDQFLKYINIFSQAVNSPDVPVLMEKDEKILRLKPVFKKLIETRSFFIIYNSQTKNIDYIEAAFVRKEEPSYLILFSIVSILLMIISNVLYKEDLDGFAAAAAAVAAAAAAAVAAAVAVAAVAAVAAVVAAVAAVADKDYRVASIIFYILMASHIVLLFI